MPVITNAEYFIVDHFQQHRDPDLFEYVCSIRGAIAFLKELYDNQLADM